MSRLVGFQNPQQVLFGIVKRQTSRKIGRRSGQRDGNRTLTPYRLHCSCIHRCHHLISHNSSICRYSLVKHHHPGHVNPVLHICLLHHKGQLHDRYECLCHRKSMPLQCSQMFTQPMLHNIEQAIN